MQQPVNACYQELKLARSFGTNSFEGTKTNIVDTYFSPGGGVLLNKLRNLDTTTNGLIDHLRSRLDASIAGVDALRSIFGEGGGTRTNASVIMKELLDNLDQDVAEFIIDDVGLGSPLNDFFNEYLAPFDPSLDQVAATLEALRGALVGVKTNLDLGGPLRAEIDELLDAHDAELQAVVAQVRQDVLTRLAQINPADNPFDTTDSSHLRGFMRQKVEDRFFATGAAAALHTTMKHRLYDLDAAVREATDSGFGIMNTALRTIISEITTKIDAELRKLAGKVGLGMAAGEINGYARINGDSLKTLRLDAKAEWQLTSPMAFSAYFQISELDSSGTPTECLPDVGTATEVTMGAAGVPISFIQSNLTATINAKFTFAQPVPSQPLDLIGLGGNIAIGGELGFGNVKVKDLYAGMGVGEIENYFSASARVLVNGYQGMGGVFIGGTCTLGVMPWDPEVSEVLGSQVPFTGFYFYGEAWIPISEVLLGIPYSCMFQISGGVGLGFGMFAEGPTFIGKGMLGLSGDVLCLVGIDATLKMVGVPSPNGVSMSGKLNIELDLTLFTIPYEAKITYENGEWDAEF